MYPGGSATLRPGWSQYHPDLKKKFIYKNLKYFICLPFQKKLGTPLVFFYASEIKFCSIICSTFKQKEKAQKKILN